MTRKFRFGLQLGGMPSAEEWVAKVQEAEALHFDTVVVPDHLFSIIAPWSALAVAAQATERIRLGTLLLNNDLRHPVVVAHEAATLNVLSNGRLELGIGAGWNRAEYDAAGLRFDGPRARVDRLTESVTILRKLLSGETVDFAGEHYTVRGHGIDLGPVAKPSPPLVIGGNGDRVLSLGARHADVINLLGMTVRPDGTRDFSTFTPEGLSGKLDVIKGVAGERFAALEKSVYVWFIKSAASAEEAAAQVQRDESISIDDLLQCPFALLGTPAEMAEKMVRIRERLGISYWIAPPNAMHEMAAAMRDLLGT